MFTPCKHITVMGEMYYLFSMGVNLHESSESNGLRLGGQIVAQVILAVSVWFIILGSLHSIPNRNYPPLPPFDIDFNLSACYVCIYIYI